MVEERRIRWGVAGCGWVARDFVIPAILQAPYAKLVALCDLNPSVVSSILPESTGIQRFSILQTFLQSPEVDAVYVATPNDSHAAVVTAAAEAGKHVFCEKPMARTLVEAEKMVAACRQANVRYATAFDQRFHARHQQIRRMIAEAQLGDISSVRIHYACWLPPEWAPDNWRVDPVRAGGGAFIDLAPHGLDLLQYLLDDSFVETSCLFQRRVFDYPVDDGAVFTGRLSQGCLAVVQVAYNCPDAFPRRTLEIIGTRGMLIARNTMGQTPGGTLQWITVDGAATDVPPCPEAHRSPFEKQIDVFSEALGKGVPFPFSPERDLETMRLIEQSQHSLCH